MMKRCLRLIQSLFLAASATFFVLSASPTNADIITLTDGRKIEGVVRSQNDFQVRINVRGALVPIPRTRVQSVMLKTPDENAQMLINHAKDSLEESHPEVARAWLDQARSFEISALKDTIDELDAKIAEYERSGGSVEERRQRAIALMLRARDAYDVIRNEEGDRLLLESLQLYPPLEEAQQLMITRFGQGDEANLGLLAEYFTALWPDNFVETQTNVIALLPRCYAFLADMFEQTSNPDKAEQYAGQLIKLANAFKVHPEWKEGPGASAALLDQPLHELFLSRIRKNLDSKNYENALAKLHAFEAPDVSEATMQLYVRALTGLGQFDEAIELLKNATSAFPEAKNFASQIEAINLLIKAKSEENTNEPQAIADYETVFSTRQQTIPEIGDAAGRQLSLLRTNEMDIAAADPSNWKASEVAVLVLQYGQDPLRRRMAGETLLTSIQNVPWRLELQWMINHKLIQTPPEFNQLVEKGLAGPLGLKFDSNSVFVLKYTIDAVVNENLATTLTANLASGQPTIPAVAILDFSFELEASQDLLGTVYEITWDLMEILPPQIKQLLAQQGAGGSSENILEAPSEEESAPPPPAMPPMPGVPPGMIPPSVPMPGVSMPPPAAEAEMPPPPPAEGSPQGEAGGPGEGELKSPIGVYITTMADIQKILSSNLIQAMPTEVYGVSRNFKIPAAEDAIRSASRQ